MSSNRNSARVRALRGANLRLAGALLLVVVVLLAVGGVAQAQDKTLYWQRYDVDITILTNGDFRVIETNELVFTSGTFRFGQREIPIDKLDGISDVTVSEEGGPDTRSRAAVSLIPTASARKMARFSSAITSPPAATQRRTIVIAYTVSERVTMFPEEGVDQLSGRRSRRAIRSRCALAVIPCVCPKARPSRISLYGAKSLTM